MGRVEKVISKFAVQTALYWGNPTPDHFGGASYDNPVEFSCRWEDSNELKIWRQGTELHSSSIILTNKEMVIEGWCFLGTLTELDDLIATNSAVLIKNKPETIPGAFIIREKRKIPMVKSTNDFVRLYYLFDYGK